MSVSDELNGMTEIALFAGAGGGVLGSKMLGIRTAAYVEWDTFPQAILKARMADGLLDAAPVFGDVREFDPAPYAGKTDIVSGGFPYQPFSNAGRQEADFDPRNMWPATRDIIRNVRPKYAYLENVAGLLTGNHGYFGVVLGELASIGYDIAWTCLPAAAVGAPHRRDRLWILGRRRESAVLPSGADHFVEFARFDASTLSWVRFGGQCRGNTESSVTSHLLFPRSGFVCPDASGTMVVYALDSVALADGKTRAGWPWPRILEDLQIPDPGASVKKAPIATGVEMMPTPNAFDAYAVGASSRRAAPNGAVTASACTTSLRSGRSTKVAPSLRRSQATRHRAKGAITAGWLSDLLLPLKVTVNALGPRRMLPTGRVLHNLSDGVPWVMMISQVGFNVKIGRPLPRGCTSKTSMTVSSMPKVLLRGVTRSHWLPR